ncbi:MAG: permease [Verrucomicrobiota bacterium]
MDILLDLLVAVWALLQSMAPWLLLGFVLSGLLSQLIPVAVVQSHLSNKSWLSIFKAVLIGIPLPLCSCGVIPVAATLRNAGASKGAVAAFTASTPQTGVDSITTTFSLMGLPFTIGRVVADLVSGLLAGSLINFFDRSDDRSSPAESSCCQSCCSEDEEITQHESNQSSKKPWKIRSILREGLIDLPGEIGIAVFVGILIGALLTIAIPENLLETYLYQNIFLTYTFVTLLSIPVYACSVGSIPVAFGLLAAGITPGAAIVFLVTGPATNTATVTTMIKLIGKSSTVIYLFSLVVGAWSVGFVVDFVGIMPGMPGDHKMAGMNSLGFISACLIVIVFANALRVKWKPIR